MNYLFKAVGKVCPETSYTLLLHPSLESLPQQALFLILMKTSHETVMKHDRKALICYFSFAKCLEPFQTCHDQGRFGGIQCRGVISDFLGCNLQGELRKVMFTERKAHSPALWPSSPPCTSGICSAGLQKEFHGGVVVFGSARWDPHHITQNSHCPKSLTSAHLSVRGPMLIWGEHCLTLCSPGTRNVWPWKGEWSSFLWRTPNRSWTLGTLEVLTCRMFPRQQNSTGTVTTLVNWHYAGGVGRILFPKLRRAM